MSFVLALEDAVVAAGTAAVEDELNAAQSYYEQALTALKAGDLGTYQSDINSMDSEIQSAQSALKAASGTTSTTTTTTTKTTKTRIQRGMTRRTNDAENTAENNGR